METMAQMESSQLDMAPKIEKKGISEILPKADLPIICHLPLDG